MVFGIITAVAACPAIVGTTEAIRHGQKQNQREEHRGRKCHLTVSLLKPSRYSAQFNNAPIVLRNGKLYVDTRKDVDLRPDLEEHFPASVNYLPFPDMMEIWRKSGYANGEGLVTWINHERHLNWVFVNHKTHAVEYGLRAPAEQNLVGPWDCTKVDRRLTFQGWEGFIAVQEDENDDMWALYFDCKDNGLKGHGQIGHEKRRMLEVEIWRKELRIDYEDAVDERAERLQLKDET
ncbi:hypothetical protein AMS68_005160 [Peltaster fructicola]|uniref:Uncharacterized protein n=1 Tax=Peltaster fructicola TaxID=286661 RepID=A0A6H0XY11_9PEZI|nr:hypothetical protein AMS68_005160 [Peltaster fructicola]